MAFGIERLERRLEQVATALTSQVNEIGEAQRQGLGETSTVLAEAVNTARTDLGSRIDDIRRAQDETTRELTTLRRDIAALHALIESRRADASEPGAGSVGEAGPQPADATAGADSDESDHHDLLAQAASIAIAELVCHGDTWAFLVEQAGGGEHFRLPVDITRTKCGTIAVELSGRTLIAITDALWHTTQTPGTPSGTHHLAAQTYNRIHASLALITTTDNGKPVRITIDDRQPHPPGSTCERAGTATA